jgi:hypothetical protein
MGIFEIAALLEVSRQRVDQISRSDPSFPSPIAELHAGRIWKRTEILEWIRRSGRTTV